MCQTNMATYDLDTSKRRKIECVETVGVEHTRGFTCMRITSWSIGPEDLEAVYLTREEWRNEVKLLLDTDDVDVAATGNCRVWLYTDANAQDTGKGPNPLASTLVRRQIFGDALVVQQDTLDWKCENLLSDYRTISYYARDACDNLTRLCCTWRL